MSVDRLGAVQQKPCSIKDMFPNAPEWLVEQSKDVKVGTTFQDVNSFRLTKTADDCFELDLGDLSWSDFVGRIKEKLTKVCPNKKEQELDALMQTLGSTRLTMEQFKSNINDYCGWTKDSKLSSFTDSVWSIYDAVENIIDGELSGSRQNEVTRDDFKQEILTMCNDPMKLEAFLTDFYASMGAQNQAIITLPTFIDSGMAICDTTTTGQLSGLSMQKIEQDEFMNMIRRLCPEEQKLKDYAAQVYDASSRFSSKVTRDEFIQYAAEICNDNGANMVNPNGNLRSKSKGELKSSKSGMVDTAVDVVGTAVDVVGTAVDAAVDVATSMWDWMFGEEEEPAPAELRNGKLERSINWIFQKTQ